LRKSAILSGSCGNPLIPSLQYQAAKPSFARGVDGVLTLLHDSTLRNRLLPQKKSYRPRTTNHRLPAFRANGAITIATVTDSCGKPCGMIAFLDKSKYRRTPRMITEQSHFCGIKDSLIRLKVVLQGLSPATESRLENKLNDRSRN
jgi:hypothetical protein